ncbi:thiamine pyrophosphokinase [Companilactobacillus sp. RD055328]|uniref:thiamine diphosphokinase n=1 Tax=Companilactobacillus sp. RD055328 TaxID=2916634 RepID=UPI001FC7D61E|nr:thiamine diphosphokinase [Companilactobacillus sp. RD055328]GKQ42569.1 thiamine pyrophosphokinase [Companilactobacillus sp. RD055328]
MKVINLLLGGPITEYPKRLLENPQNIEGDWIAADHGASYLLKKGIVPKYTVGDFDSSSNADYQNVVDSKSHIIQVPSEKDFTDTQLALNTVIDNFEFDEIHLYGATGGRIDHLLANIFLGVLPEYQSIIEKIKIIDEDNFIEFFKPGIKKVKKITNMKYIGFVTLGIVNNLNLINSKYHLNNYTNQFEISWASNEFIDEYIDFNFESGTVVAIQSKDRK